MYDLLIVGSGIGAAGLLSKIKNEYKHKKICIVTKGKDSYQEFKSDAGFNYEYLIRKNLGNVHDWGGVLTLSNYVLDNFDDSYYSTSIKNYYHFSNKDEVGNSFVSSLLKKELVPVQLDDNISHRKLLISNRKLLEKSFYKQLEDLNVTIVHDDVNLFTKFSSGYKIKTISGVEIHSSKLALCAGSINTRKILINSGYIDNDDFYATDSKFGRIGRIRFGTAIPFGFFHHHMISKSIRFKTGFETKGNDDVMFFLQPAIRGIPASDIHLLKEFLTLKTDFSLRNIISFLTKPKAIIQILLMEFSFLNKTTDFDVYCIGDYGKRKYSDKGEFLDVDLDGFDSSLISAYEKFIRFLKKYADIETVDHAQKRPLVENMESALHMSGTVYYNCPISYDEESRLYTLSSDDNIIINDNSIIHTKGVANPSIQLF